VYQNPTKKHLTFSWYSDFSSLGNKECPQVYSQHARPIEPESVSTNGRKALTARAVYAKISRHRQRVSVAAPHSDQRVWCHRVRHDVIEGSLS
jgi:hypothetical protein